MAKKSMTPSERREAILRVLCQRRQDKIDNLAEEFGVSVRTIKNDIEELTLAHPIETVRGRYLDLLTVGLVIDMWTEKANDSVKYNKIATQDDFDKF